MPSNPNNPSIHPVVQLGTGNFQTATVTSGWHYARDQTLPTVDFKQWSRFRQCQCMESYRLGSCTCQSLTSCVVRLCCIVYLCKLHRPVRRVKCRSTPSLDWSLLCCSEINHTMQSSCYWCFHCVDVSTRSWVRCSPGVCVSVTLCVSQPCWVCLCLSVCVCSKESQEALNSWTHYDNQQDSFCETEGPCLVFIVWSPFLHLFVRSLTPSLTHSSVRLFTSFNG